jgi:hypothetical protein
MSEKLRNLPVFFVIAFVLVGVTLAGCGSGSTGQAATQEQQVSAPASTATPDQTSVPSAGQPGISGTTPGAQQGRPGGPGMSKMFSRAAQILGVTEAQFTSAFQQAQESVFGKTPSGTAGTPPAPPSGTSGQQPPAPPSGTPGQQPPAPPSGTSGQQPPPGGQGPNSEMMQKVYSKMAEILNISADKISGAMDQARQELLATGK